MEVVQSQWFHWQWNNNETKGLRGFTVHVEVGLADVTCAQLGRLQKYTEGWSSENTHICILMKCFKQRKLQVDPSEKFWYAEEQYDERTEQNIGTHVDNGPPAVMHS